MTTRTTSIQLPFLIGEAPKQDNHGAVYTKPWVVDLMLDLAGYSSERDLSATTAVEPAIGDGVFVVAMARRLVESAHRHGRSVSECQSALTGFDLDPVSVTIARTAVTKTLVELGIAESEAASLAAGWLRRGNYLFEAPTLPAVDFVIGNPPYIRLEDIGDDIAWSYRALYRTMKGRADIYVAFFEAALRQLKPDGVCVFICADRWMLNQYGAELRRFVTSAFGVETVIEMHTANAFESDVSAYPAITVIRRSIQGPVVVARADSTAAEAGVGALIGALNGTRAEYTNGSTHAGLTATRVDTWFDDTAPWPCTSPERLSLLRRLENEFPPLESVETGTRVSIGVATGSDQVFISKEVEGIEPSRLLPLAMAKDTLSGKMKWSGSNLVNPWDSDGLIDLSNFPRTEAYFEKHRDVLERRNVAQRNPHQWYRTIDRVNHGLISRRKLYVPDIKDRLHPVLDEGETYPHHNLYVIYSVDWDLEVLGGLLLSDIGQFFVECYGVRMRGGWLRFQAQYLRRIRVPAPTNITEVHARMLTEAFRQRNREAATKVALDVYGIDALPMKDE